MQKKTRNKLIKRSLALGFQNFWRNPVLSWATIAVFSMILLLLNFILAVQMLATNDLNNISEKIDIVINIKDSTEFEQLETIQKDLEDLEEVKKVSYTSKEQAFLKFSENSPELAERIQKLEINNPFPASLRVTTFKPDQHRTVSQFIKQDRYLPYIKEIAGSEENKVIANTSENLMVISEHVNRIILWLILVFVIGGALIIINALYITIFTRRKELEVMKLVGSPLWFIRMPFITEALIYSLLATIISNIIFALIFKNFIWGLFFIQLMLSSLLAFISAYIATELNLRKKIEK